MSEKKPNRRKFLKAAAVTAGGAALAGAGVYLGSVRRVSRAAGKKVIVIGIDGMDPRLSERMMRGGALPNLARLRAAGGFSSLGTSTPPQSPVAWANFINGAGPGSHGIFDFVHRHPQDQVSAPFYAGAETLPGEGAWELGEHQIPLDFWPFNHQPAQTVLRRQGTPFWNYLDEAGVPTTFYDLPSNYPPSPSTHGHHRCICGMGTPDLLGSYSTYQFFADDGPAEPTDEDGGRRSKLDFDNETARAQILGPNNGTMRGNPATNVDFTVHRDRDGNGAVIQVQGKRIVLRAGQWSPWTELQFELKPWYFITGTAVSGICRFYLQQVSPNFRLYVSPININPADPATPISEPASFVKDVASRRGSFYTTGFQEDYNARKNNLFNDDEYLRQANLVLDDRLKLLEDAMQNYDDGVMFFYFSSSDLQSHMFWWEGGDHPSRDDRLAAHLNRHVRRLYQRLDEVVGDLHDRYGSQATIIVMSDHGFANFGMQFNLNSWLRDNDYLNPRECTSLRRDVDWSQTKAYGLGINGLYLNLKGRERDGIVEPDEVDELVERLTNGLLAVQYNDQPIIRGVHRSRDIYQGSATALAPDLIIGYHRGFRASWATTSGNLSEETLEKNELAWSADHCMDALEVPGVLWCNHTIRGANPSLVDIAPSILAEYGLATPSAMTGRNVF